MIEWEYKIGSANGTDKEGRYHAIAISKGITVGYIRREKFCQAFMFSSVITNGNQSERPCSIELFEDIPRAKRYIEKHTQIGG
jgi:hypothetical protein